MSLTPAMLVEGFVISVPGDYRLEASAAIWSRRGLVVAASDVSLDLQGYSLEGSSRTDAVIEVEAGRANVLIRDGAVRGGFQGVFIGLDCSDVRVENLYVANFCFAGLVTRPARDVAITSCTFGRARSAPTGSVFGVVALPKGGFSSADKIMQGLPVRSALADGGRGLFFSRVTVSDVCPLSPGGCALTAPFITDAGGLQLNVSGDADVRPCRAYNLTHDPKARVRRLGAIPRPAPEAPEPDAVESAGAHAVTLFNWLDVRGVPSELSIERPATIPGCRGWGGSSALLEMQTPRALSQAQAQRAAPRNAEDELAQVPLGVRYVRQRQDASPPGVFVPGALGSFVIAS